MVGIEIARAQTPELRPELKELTRALLPQRNLITGKKLDKIVREIISDARSVHAFCKRIRRVLPPEKVAPKIYSPPPAPSLRPLRAK